MKTLIKVLALSLTMGTSITNAALPDPGMEIVKGRTAILVTD